MNIARKHETMKTMYQRKNKKLYILGESIVKRRNEYLLTKKR